MMAGYPKFNAHKSKILWLIFSLCYFAFLKALLAHPIDFGPIYYNGIDVYGRKHITAFGPLLETREDANTNKLFAIHPLYSGLSSLVESKSEKNILWPIWMASEDDINYDWKLIYLVFWRDFNKHDEAGKYRFWLLPIYFQGRNDEGKNYVALFPVAGKLHDFLAQDEIVFCLFPIYSRWRVNEVQTYNFLWPIFSCTKGEAIRRHRAFPFYGYSRLRDDYEKYFILWPIWSYAAYHYPGSSGYGYIFFPVFGRTRIETENTIFVLPPFFRYTAGKKQNVVNTPWPILQFSSGKTHRKYFWPICGKRERENDSYFFFLWPIYNSWFSSNKLCVSKRKMLIPFYYAEETQYILTNSVNSVKNFHPTNTASFKLWPLISWKKQDAKERTRIFSLFPFRDFEPIERNYDPLWTIYSSEKNEGEVERSFLWGVVRYRFAETTGTKYFSIFPLFNFWKDEDNNCSWMFLKGFFGREYVAKEKKIKLLYFFSF